jgi:hypothetical protein
MEATDIEATLNSEISELQAELTRVIQASAVLSGASAVLSDDSVRTDVTQPSPARSPLHLASLSSDPHEPLRSSFPDGSPTTAAAGFGIPSVSSSSMRDSVRDELFRELKQELFAEMRSELLRSKQENAMILQENAAFRKRIDELESASVRASTPTSSGSHRSTPASSTPASPANNTPPDQPAESHLVDPVVFLTQLGNFNADEARWALSQSNYNAHAAADLLLSCPSVPSARIRFEESQYRSPTPRGRGRGGGVTFQPGRGGFTPQFFPLNPAPSLQSAPSAAASSVNADHLASTLGKLTDVIENLGPLLTDSMSRNARATRDSKQRLMSGHKFDVSKIHQYTGDCILGAPDEYWLRPGAWTKQFRNLMLSCTISNEHWTHFALMCCGPTVVTPWEKKFERPSNAGPGWQSSLQLEVQDDGLDVPYARRQSWPAFVRWLSDTFNNRALFEVQHGKFKQVSQLPGESVHAYNVRWTLEKDLVDELAGAEVYPDGTIHAEQLESIYIRSLLGSFSSRLLDLRAISGTLSQVMLTGARDTASDGGLPVGLQLLQQHAVKLDNDQTIASELRKLQSPRSTTRPFFRKSLPFSPQPRNIQRITHLDADPRFSELEDENAAQSECCQDLFFKLQTDGKVNWSAAQMKRLWSDKCCFRCGKQGHQWADCKASQPANPKAFQFANLISSTCPDADDSIPEEDDIRSYLQAVESGHLN